MPQQLRTRAVRDRRPLLLNGPKPVFRRRVRGCYVVMVRTGADGPGGISTLVIEGDTPGCRSRQRAQDGLERAADPGRNL